MIQSDYKKFKDYNIAQLIALRYRILNASSQEELIDEINSALAAKEAAKKTLNYRFPIDWMNVDQEYKELLHRHDIENLHQLLEIDDLKRLPGITEEGIQQLSWARDFFDMTPFEGMTVNTEEEKFTAVKIIVKQAQQVSNKNNGKMTN